MLPALEIIVARRRKLGLTQSQLAELAGVSQSYIAKLESGKIEPSYLKVKAIFESLERLEKKNELQAGQVMTPNPVGVQRNASVKEAVDLMRENGFSQLPVFDGEKHVGGVTESGLIEHLIPWELEDDPGEVRVEEVMEEAWPLLGEEAPISLLSSLLRYYPAVLVQRRGRVVGIVTKADLLRVFEEQPGF